MMGIQVEEWMLRGYAAATALSAVTFCAVVLASLRYGVAGWALPLGVEAANLSMRRCVGVALGAGAVAAASMTLQPSMILQIVLMSAAAVNDFARFRLPLPLTIGGIACALAGGVESDLPFVICEAAVFVGLLRILRMDVGGGDVLAAVWIVAAAPWHGAAAICVGHAAWLAAAHIIDPQRRVLRAPIGGAWLMATAWLLPLLRAWGMA